MEILLSGIAYYKNGSKGHFFGLTKNAFNDFCKEMNYDKIVITNVKKWIK